MEEWYRGECEQVVVCLHKEVRKSCPTKFAIKFLQKSEDLAERTNELTPYALDLAPGGNARRPQACWTSLG